MSLLPHTWKFEPRLPTFVRCLDGRYYQDLVYQDLPARRAWFICFDPEEPAELVIREDFLIGDMTPRVVLKGRGFDKCVYAFMPGRKTIHKRFFGPEGGIKEAGGHDAVSYFLRFRKGTPLPNPTGQDSCVKDFPYHPNIDGVYFGDRQ